MEYTNNILVLVADSDEKNRTYMAGMLGAHGYEVIQALDGGTAIKVVEEHSVDLAVIGDDMKPHTGLEFAAHILVKGYKIGLIMVATDPSVDLLQQAGHYNIKQILTTPVDSARLIETTRRVLRSCGKNPDAVAGRGEKSWARDDLMRRVIALAEQNAKAGMGGPFAALVADAQGHILGEGVNAVQIRCDPTAHAEVLAIRRATEKMQKTDLSGCTLYCSSEPTMLGQALIIGTGLSKVYYGLSHEETGGRRRKDEGILTEIAKPIDARAVPYERCAHDEALAMFRAVNVPDSPDSSNSD